MTDRIIGPDSGFRDGDRHYFYGTTIAVGRTAALLIGPSGSGKSGLALQAMASGALLVADDQTILTRRGDGIVATCPDPLKGRIEARGVGLLRAEVQESALLQLVIDMEQVETDRLPPVRSCRILGVPLPLLHKVESVYFAAAVMQYLKGGRSD